MHFIPKGHLGIPRFPQKRNELLAVLEPDRIEVERVATNGPLPTGGIRGHGNDVTQASRGVSTPADVDAVVLDRPILAWEQTDVLLASEWDRQVRSDLPQQGDGLHGRKRATRTQRVTQPIMGTVHPVDSDPVIEQLLSLQERRRWMRCVALSPVLDASAHVTAKVLRELFGYEPKFASTCGFPVGVYGLHSMIEIPNRSQASVTAVDVKILPWSTVMFSGTITGTIDR